MFLMPTARNFCIGAAFMASAFAANASETQRQLVQWQPGLNFDLLRDCPQTTSGIVIAPLSQVSRPAQMTDWAVELHGFTAKEELGPRWQYQRGISGPVLQFAALGAGQKERPGLAHFALDWYF